MRTIFFALSSITETASTALHKRQLVDGGRKAEILETLVTVSHEITSTLNLERMLQDHRNCAAAVIPTNARRSRSSSAADSS